MRGFLAFKVWTDFGLELTKQLTKGKGHPLEIGKARVSMKAKLGITMPHCVCEEQILDDGIVLWVEKALETWYRTLVQIIRQDRSDLIPHT